METVVQAELSFKLHAAFKTRFGSVTLVYPSGCLYSFMFIHSVIESFYVLRF